LVFNATFCKFMRYNLYDKNILHINDHPYSINSSCVDLLKLLQGYLPRMGVYTMCCKSCFVDNRSGNLFFYSILMKILNALIWLPIIGVIFFVIRHLFFEKHLRDWAYPFNATYHAIMLFLFIIYFPQVKSYLLGLL